MERNQVGRCIDKSEAQRQVWIANVDVEASSISRWLKP